MKHENPETKLIREQNRYIRILEEQLDVCKEQLDRGYKRQDKT